MAIELERGGATYFSKACIVNGTYTVGKMDSDVFGTHEMQQLEEGILFTNEELVDGKPEDDTETQRDSGPEMKRQTWSTNLDFLLTCIGFAVGLGNIWRFPYLCYKNGGGAFLIPYGICLMCGGIPVFMLELGLGQYMKRGGIAAWKICPAFQGIGIASIIIMFLVNIYYIIILAWDIYYLFMSFTTELPWSHCNNDWNTERCFVPGKENASHNPCFPGSVNCSASSSSFLNNDSTKDPVVEFWERKLLRISDGIDHPGTVVWELALSLLFVWVVVYFCIWRGVKWSGKVVYFTATFPYVVLTILVIRGVTLDGASDGLIFYLKPDLLKLNDAQVWIDGGTQIFFTFATGLGAMTTLGSYSKFNNNFYRDCIIISCINCLASLYGGLAVFSVLGFMAKQQNVSVADVASKGPGMVFLTYPKAVTQMPVPPVWAALFFVMIFLIGIDCQFVGVEAFVTPIIDYFPKTLHRMRNRMIFTAGYCILAYLIGLTMVTEGGMYVMQLLDYYSASGLVILWVCFFESVVIGWVFGANRFYDVIELMIGSTAI